MKYLFICGAVVVALSIELSLPTSKDLFQIRSSIGKGLFDATETAQFRSMTEGLSAFAHKQM